MKCEEIGVGGARMIGAARMCCVLLSSCVEKFQVVSRLLFFYGQNMIFPT